MRMIRDNENVGYAPAPDLARPRTRPRRLVEATKPKWLFAIDPQWTWQRARVVMPRCVVALAPLI